MGERLLLAGKGQQPMAAPRTTRAKGTLLIDSFSRRRRLFVVIVLLAAVYLLGRLTSAKGTRCRPLPVTVKWVGDVAFAAGAGGGGRGTAQSNYRSECATCHGRTGKGDGWTAWIFRLKVGDLTDAVYMRTLSDDYIFQIIKQGGASLGKPGMPSWGQELTDREIRELVVYIRSLAAPPPPQPSGAAR